MDSSMELSVYHRWSQGRPWQVRGPMQDLGAGPI